MIPAAALVALLAWQPGLVAAGVAAVMGRRAATALGRRAEGRRERAAAESDMVVLAELSALALSSGLTMTGALRAAAGVVAQPLASEIDRVLRRAAVEGTEAALEAAGGRLAVLGRLVARAQATGAPLAEVVEGFAAAERSREQGRRQAAGRRLPVLLLIPLALLILPGFVLIVAGPAVLGGLARLEP